ncbi:MAG: ERCC4 domain-containing protein [Planctomycetia bacterium]|nr:ERCC4 domain-containing protein [Planctomycetia bacterium]
MGTVKLTGNEPFLELTQVVDKSRDTAPFVVAVDTREQNPFRFLNLEKQVFTVTQTLKTGDYSVIGFEKRVCVERKSKQDLFSSTIHGRERFEKEVERMAKMERVAVVVEATLEEVRKGLEQSQINPQSVVLTALAWSGRYRIPWFFCQNRADAERMTFDFLRFAWEDFTDGRKNGRKATNPLQN